LNWFDGMESPIVCDWLTQWPTLEHLQEAKPAKVRVFLKQHRYSDERTEQLMDSLPLSIAATNDPAVIDSCVLTVRRMLAQLKALRVAIGEHDKKIKELAATHPNEPIFASFPSAGPVMVPRLIAAWGTQPERFETSASMQSFAGIAPVVERSGKQMWTHWRWACPKFLRQTFHEWAWLSVRQSEWAREYYDGQRAKQKSHHAAVRALAFKWIRIIYSCWKNHCPYDEARYVAQLKKHSLAQPKAAPALSLEIEWKTVGGFSKPGPVSA
jgi:transposase